MFPISEPIRGFHLLQWWNTIVFTTPILKVIIPVLADIFVFSYPIFLVFWYLKGIVKHYTPFKIQALAIFMSTIVGSLLNIVIQYMTEKQRPELYITNKNQLILSHLPTDPFPSDHACVSAAIATATLLIAYQTNNLFLKGVGYFFLIASLLMGISRVGVAVHWPTDILVGWGVGIFSGYLVIIWFHEKFNKYLYKKLIWCEQYILTGLFKK